MSGMAVYYLAWLVAILFGVAHAFTETQLPTLHRMAWIGAAFFFPIALPLAALICIAAALYCAPFAAIKLWRRITAEIHKDAEEIANGGES